ncbi:T9SS type A sorting domain-containing protein [Reichenbachiella carrageenanivorans]|uniref:T9SS type A sorting domain-containing protein n=1 Tax=Reichenbachiella carrageenanivorans TaxID=2979869 RepID=A0ABY6D1M7_9BACT|nr:T9SS type A sorting domain-containing protein [Reichenbachiella carrageenanivorans]UXX80069.1 T9SS type A sorting domain-containing protein [Reichenbachiella carrageenanivorans]
MISVKKLFFTVGLGVACLLQVHAQYSFETPEWFRVDRALPLVDLDTKVDILVSDHEAHPNDGLDDSLGIANAFQAAKLIANSGNPVRIVFEAGTYDFSPTDATTHALKLNYGRYIELDGTGAKIMMHNPKVGFLSMYDARHMIVKGFEVDYDPLPYTEGKVLSVDPVNKRFVMKVTAGVPYPDEDHITSAPERWGMLKTANGMLKDGASNLLNIDTAYQLNADTFQIVFKQQVHIDQVEVNDYYVQIARHNGRTIFQSNSGEQVTFLNTKSYSSPAGSYNTFHHKEWSMIDCKILIKPGRVHSANADCIHISGGIIGPWVQGCRFEGQSDDAVNMKYASLTITEVESPTQMKVGFSSKLFVGDTVSFFNPRDGALIERVGLVDTVHNLGSNSYRIFLSSPVYLSNFNTDNSGDRAYLDTKACESFVFRDDTIRNSRRYGMLLQNGYGVIEDCLFENLSGCAIRMENGVDWKEGFVAHDIEIKNNTFTNCGFDAKFNEDEHGISATISTMIAKLGDGACDPWCGSAMSDWDGFHNIRIAGNTFNYNIGSINFNNLKSEYLPDLDLVDGFSTFKVGLDSVFKDILQGTLSYSATSSETSIATVSIVSDSVQIVSIGDGLTKINVTADDGNGGTATSGFWLSASGGISATRIFQGSGGKYWNIPANWQDDMTPSIGESARIDADSSLVTQPYSLSQLYNATSSSSTILNGGSLLTIDNKDRYTIPGILNNSSTGARFKLDVPVDIRNSIDNNAVYISNNGSNDNIIEFGEKGTLTLNATTLLSTNGSTSSHVFEFNGTLNGVKNLTFGSSTTSVFGSTSDNSGFNADLVFWGNADVTVNMQDDATFLNTDQKIQINGHNSNMTVNAANCLDGNISIASTHTFNLSINENQSDLDRLFFSSTGKLVLNLDSAVSLVHFEDNSAANWSTGAVEINGFQNGVIRFGSSAGGLTATQLSQITIGGVSPTIDSDGYLTMPASRIGQIVTAIIVEDKTVMVNESFQLDLLDVFEDLNEPDVVYELTLGNSEIISAKVDNSMLIVTGQKEGRETLTLLAEKEGGTRAKISFAVNVAAPLSSDDQMGSTVLYPNPFSGDFLNLKGLGTTASELRVCDLAGTVWTTLKVDRQKEAKIPFGGAPSGMYLIEIIDADGVVQKTFRAIKR